VKEWCSLGEKSWEIKGGGQEMVAMMLMLIKLNNNDMHIWQSLHTCTTANGFPMALVPVQCKVTTMKSVIHTLEHTVPYDRKF